MTTLSVIIPVLNDDAECHETIRSLRATAPSDLEVIVVDDHSDIAFVTLDSFVRVHRNPQRIGCAPSRHLAATLALGSHFLITDSHMRFEPGWYPKILDRMDKYPETTWLGTCLRLSPTNMDLTKSQADHGGATFNFCGIDPNKHSFKQVLEGNWKSHADGEEVACLMGATYFVPRSVFFKVGGLEHLRKWGSDEPYLSLKIWLAGHEIRMAKDVRIGHRFREAAPYLTNTWEITYNKLWAIRTILGDSDPATVMLGKLEELTPPEDWEMCMTEVRANRSLILSTRQKYRATFVHDLRWLCDKFNIPFPGEG